MNPPKWASSPAIKSPSTLYQGTSRASSFHGSAKTTVRRSSMKLASTHSYASPPSRRPRPKKWPPSTSRGSEIGPRRSWWQLKKSPFDVLLDGPYGNVSVDIHSSSVYSHFALFSGGIGVTPMRSIVNWLHSEHRSGFRPDIKNVHFVWSVRDRDLIQALVSGPDTHDDELYFPALIQDPATMNTATSEFYTEFYLTRGERDVEAQLDHQLSNCLRYCSRPDTAKILRAMGEKALASGGLRVAVLVCGPKPLVNGVVATSLELSKEMNISFDVHTELFDF